MAASTRQMMVGVTVAVAIAAISISVIGGAAALAPATERVQTGVTDAGRHEAALPLAPGRLSEHQELRRIFIDDARARMR